MISAFNRLIGAFPRASSRFAAAILRHPHAIRALHPAAAMQLRSALDQGEDAGYRQECYAQEGEDLVMTRLLGEQPSGFYVDVGAHHPTRHSNTFLLYRQGWRGINIDATPGSMAAFQRLRPRDINIECLIASDTSPRVFHRFNEPALNTASPELAKLRPSESEHFQIVDSVTLQPRSLAALLDEHLPRGQGIDVMSVDVEGLDLDVLASNNWQRYRPKLLLVELLATELANLDEHEIVRFLRAEGYRPIAKLYNTVIFR